MVVPFDARTQQRDLQHAVSLLADSCRGMVRNVDAAMTDIEANPAEELFLAAYVATRGFTGPIAHTDECAMSGQRDCVCGAETLRARIHDFMQMRHHTT